jgi:hypothetical protein
MSEWVSRQYVLGGVVACFLFPCGEGLVAGDCTRVPISEQAVYEQAQRLHARSQGQGSAVELSLESAAGTRVAVSYFRPEALSAVPFEFFIRYPFRPDLAVPTQLGLLFKMAQHIRNFYNDPADSEHESVYQVDISEETRDLLKNKELNRYMVYVLHIYSLNLHRNLDRPTNLTEAQTAALHELTRLQGFQREEESDVPTSWGMPVETHIRRAQYTLWALQALSEITLNLSAFRITYAEIRELVETAKDELFMAAREFIKEGINGQAQISAREYGEKTHALWAQYQAFLNYRWRVEAAEVE